MEPSHVTYNLSQLQLVRQPACFNSVTQIFHYIHHHPQVQWWDPWHLEAWTLITALPVIHWMTVNKPHTFSVVGELSYLENLSQYLPEWMPKFKEYPRWLISWEWGMSLSWSDIRKEIISPCNQKPGIPFIQVGGNFVSIHCFSQHVEWLEDQHWNELWTCVANTGQ